MTDPDYLRPLGIATLPPDSLACRHCGRAVRREDAARIETLTAESYRPPEDEREEWERHVRAHREAREMYAARPARPGDMTAPPPPKLFDFATCHTCAGTLERAARILAAHRAASARVGGVMAERLELALFRLDMFGKPLTDADADALTDAGALSLAEHLGMGGMPHWADRFHPIHRGGQPGTCAPEPWGHVDGDMRTVAAHSLRAWEAARLAARRAAVEKPHPIPCPDGSACMLCGIPSVNALSRDAPHVWQPFRASISGLGGRGRGQLDGYLCPVDWRVYDDVRAAGPTLLERSLFAHFHPDGAEAARGVEIRGLYAWAVSGATPNAKPWGHVRATDIVTARLLGEPWHDDLSPDALALLAAVAGHVSADAAAELRAALESGAGR